MLAHLGKIRQVTHEDITCFKLYSYFEKAAFSSSFSRKDANGFLCDNHIGNYLRTYIQKIWHIISRQPSNPLDWKPTTHRLFAIFTLYMVSKQKGNEMIWNSIRRPLQNFLSILKIIRKRNPKLRHSTFSQIIPKSNQINLDKLFCCVLSQFTNIEVYPSCPEEENNIELIKLIMERYIPNEWPLDILMLLDVEKNYDMWKVLYDARQTFCLKIWKNTLNKLPQDFKKYVKLIILFYKRRLQLSIKYTTANKIKCSNAIPADWKTHLLTLCTYCMECLTYIDINKRPASFGHYINGDSIKQFCHRDDSDRLLLISCFHPTNLVSLEIGHPDRNPVTLCQGKRSCFELVSFSDKLCPSCSYDLNEIDIHENTCIGKEHKSNVIGENIKINENSKVDDICENSGKEKRVENFNQDIGNNGENRGDHEFRNIHQVIGNKQNDSFEMTRKEKYCKGCEVSIERDIHIFKRIESARTEKIENESIKIKQDENLKIQREERRRMFNRYKFQKAYEWNERKKLLK